MQYKWKIIQKKKNYKIQMEKNIATFDLPN